MVAWTKLVAGKEIKSFETRGEFVSDGSNMRLDMKRKVKVTEFFNRTTVERSLHLLRWKRAGWWR